ncbi:spore germination protein [Paenibacillus sp. YN15]|uniref:spore germination protein n=1 Tax=Paenibacillus sp. YN15 TaxID=1742774 RepID=UPI0015EB2FBA|nr:spore germination protein [Paenibacillus sp. YN15]
MRIWSKANAKRRIVPSGQTGIPESYPQGTITAELSETVAFFRESLALCSDLVIKETEVRQQGGAVLRVAVMYVDGLANRQLVHEFITQPLATTCLPESQAGIAELEKLITATNIRRESGRAKLMYSLLNSSTLVFLENAAEGLAISSEGWEHRQVQEPVTESAIRGPQEAFNEVLRVNTALIRRRIKDPRLAVESLQVGTRSLTDVAVLYIRDIAHPKLVNEVKRRIRTIEMDGMQDIGQMEEFLEDNPLSPFPQVTGTERVDKTVAAILEGKVAVMLDGSPYALSMPSTFASFLYASEDYYSKFMAATFVRWFRGLALLMALFLPSLYIALITFHQEMLPTPLMLSSAANRTGVPFPAFFEALLMEASIELLREASLRLPGSLGQTIGIVGALVIGQSAVQAGFVGPILTIIVAFTAIGSFVIPNYNTSITIRMLRFPLMLLAATMGMFGILFGGAAILLHLVSLTPFGVGYLEPFRPSRWADLDDSILIRKPTYLMSLRQRYLKPQQRRR